MNEGQYDDGVEAVEAALRAWGEANIPEGFDETLRSFDELMEAVRAVPEPRVFAVTEVADHAEFGLDAMQLGAEFLEQGDFEKAERWFRCAIRYGVPEAEAKLADLLELRDALQEIRDRHDRPSKVTGLDAARATWSRWLQGLDATEPDPYVEAQRIIAQAEKQAAQIVTAARARARSTTSQTATSDLLRVASSRSLKVDFPRGLDVDVIPAGVGAIGSTVACFVVSTCLTESSVDSMFLRKLAGATGSVRSEAWADLVMFCNECETSQLRGSYARGTRLQRARDVDLVWAAEPDFNASLTSVIKDLLLRHLGREWIDEVYSRAVHQMDWPRKLPYSLNVANAVSGQLQQPVLKELLLAR